jgi:hypothetical protein
MHPNFKPEPFIARVRQDSIVPAALHRNNRLHVIELLSVWIFHDHSYGADTAGKQGTAKWDKTNSHSNTVSQDTG